MEHNQVNLENVRQQLHIKAAESKLRGDKSSRTENEASELDLEVSIVTDPSDIEQDWLGFEQRLNAGHANSNWALAWYAAHRQEGGATAYILVGRNTKGDVCFVLPLELTTFGPAKVLLSPGAGHATYADGLFDHDILDLFHRGQGDRFWDTVFGAFDNIDAMALEGFSLQREGAVHPFAHLPLVSAAHGAMQMTIEPDWSNQYLTMVDSKTRGNDRRVERRLNEQGLLEHQVAVAEPERLQLLDVMLMQKAEQFELLQITNPYKSPEVVAFYRNLIRQDANHADTSLYISSVLLDKEPLAVNFGILNRNELQGLITSMTSGEHRRFSPGRLLMIKTNEYLSSINVQHHDFGMGEFNYKKEWCDQNIDRHHVLKAFSLTGHAFVAAQRAKQSLKTTLNNHIALKSMLKRLRHRASQSKK
ncbi:MAG: GNAT family N-acetyltransferase [Rhizobiaceae bacterium]|nr:GNAT family N-acetyltransferase [Hyphomicrobiales bacterium]NRB31204.1 GNAT family N-acetyltransferase [Rhizobiaceae bacterium]